MRIETSYLFYFIDRAVEPFHDLVQNMFFSTSTIHPIKKKTKEDKKLMHSYLPFKNVPWVEIRPFAEWCAEVH